MKSLFKNFILYLLALSLCNIKMFDDLNLLSVTNMQKIQINRKGAKTFSRHCKLEEVSNYKIYIVL